MDDFIYAPPPPPPPSVVKPEENEIQAPNPSSVTPNNENNKPKSNPNQKNKKRPLDNTKNNNNNNKSNQNNRKKKQKTAPTATAAANGQGVDLDHEDEKIASDYNDDDDFSDEESKHTTIQGTNIVLQSEEDIAKWIQERKKNWPSEKRMKQKAEEIAERQKVLDSQRSVTGADGNIGTNSLNTGNKRVCKFYAKNRKCRNGDNCKFLHEFGASSSNRSNNPASGGNNPSSNNGQRQGKDLMKRLANHKTVVLHGIPVQVPLRFKPSLNRGKSLHNLVIESEQMTSENHKLLNLFDAIVNSGLIDTDWDGLKSQLHLA